ncbi:MAG: hypothetical protein HY964_05260 [Ignavibacteriales bacterium]|nr:hypothetical protein [Ignavibacteriales bacterium]
MNNLNRIAKITNYIFLGIIFLLIVIFAFREIYSPDLGFHLRAGEWIIKNLKIPANDEFTFTSAGREYIDLNWLFQIFIAFINKIWGEFGIVFSNAILLVGTFMLLYLRMKRKGFQNGYLRNQIIFFLSVASTAVFFEQRPHTFSWLFFNIILFVLERYEEDRSTRLILLPIIMLIWVNTHVLFVLGLIAIFVYLIGISYHDKKIPLDLFIYFMASSAVILLNPHLFKGIWLPFIQFQLLQSNNIFKEAISELASPLSFKSYLLNGEFVFLQPIMWFHIFLPVSITLFIAQIKRLKLHNIILFVLFIYLALSAVRNIGFFVFAIAPALLVVHKFRDDNSFTDVGNISNIQRILKIISYPIFKIANSIILLFVLCLLAISLVTDVYYINFRSNDRFGYKYNSHVLPVAAASFLRENNLTGKILNHFNFGGFLIYTIPQKVFIDGRTEVMGEQMFYQYSILWNQIDKKPIIEKYNPDIIIFPHQNEFLWVHYLRADSNWRLVFVDELAAIYLKKGYEDKITSINWKNAPNEYRIIRTEEFDQILKSPSPSGYPLFKFAEQKFPLTELGLSTFYYYNDQFDVAIQIGLNGLMQSTVRCPEMYYNLGHYYFEAKDYDRSAYCYKRFLETNKDGLASHRLQMIESGRIQIWKED